MGPFDVNPDWFDKHWYSPEPPKPMWRMPATLATIAVVMLAALYPQIGPSTSSHRLSPPFARLQVIPHFNSGVGK
jgi:hypothetical protein